MSFGENVRKDSVVRLLTSAIFTGLVRDGAVAGCIKIKVLFWAEYGIILTESPVLLDFPAIRGFFVTNLLSVQCSF